MFTTLLVSFFLLINLSKLTYANDSGSMESLTDVNLWSTFIQDMAQYTDASCIYVVTDSTKSVASSVRKVQIGNFRSIWFRFLSSTNITLIKESITSNETWSTIVILECDWKMSSSILKEVMDDTNTLNKVSWIMEYSDAEKWFYNKNQDIAFSPSIRLFVILIKHFKRGGTNVIIKYAYFDYENEIAKMAIMGYWQLNHGLTKTVPFSRCCYNLTGYPLKIVYIKEDEPYSRVQKIGNTLEIAGATGSILKILLKFLDIKTVKLEKEPTDTYGGLDQNSKPTGLFKMLATKVSSFNCLKVFTKSCSLTPEVCIASRSIHPETSLILQQSDIALSVAVYTADRMKIADMTDPVLQNLIIGLYKPPDNNPTFWSLYVKSFSVSSWILILTLILFLMMFTMILMRYYPEPRIVHSNQFDILAICGLLLSQGSTQDHTSVGWRIYYFSVMVLGTLLVAFYGSKIVAENAVSKRGEFFKDFYEVANHPLYRPVIWAGSGTLSILKSSSDPEISALWNRIKKNMNHFTVKSEEQLIEQLECCQGVFVGTSYYIKFLKSQNPSFVILEHSLGTLQLGFPLQKNSPLTRIFNTILNDLDEGGIIERIKNDNFNVSSKMKKTKIVKQIVLSEIKFPITIIATVNFLAIIFCSIEKIWVRHRMAK